jgi:hypothetical protein
VHEISRSAVTLFALSVLAACAGPPASPRGSPGAPPPPPPPSTVSHDPTLTAAADAVEPFLRTSFGNSFAGLVVDPAGHTLIVYRRPDPDLDGAVRQRVPATRVVFRDAKHSLREMQELAARVMDDADHWKDRGVGVNGAGPASDGSGVEVMTTDGSPADQRAMDERYGAGAVKVSRGSAVPPIGRTPWRPSPGGPSAP